MAPTFALEDLRVWAARSRSSAFELSSAGASTSINWTASVRNWSVSY